MGLPGLGYHWQADVALSLVAVASVGMSTAGDSHGGSTHGSSTRARFLVRVLRGIAAHTKVRITRAS